MIKTLYAMWLGNCCNRLDCVGADGLAPNGLKEWFVVGHCHRRDAGCKENRGMIRMRETVGFDATIDSIDVDDEV